MPDAFIYDHVRTPRGRGKADGALHEVTALNLATQALAAVSGRDFAMPDDVKKMALPVLAHRLILKPESRLRKRTPTAVVQDLVDDARVPITDKMKASQEDYFDN